MMALINRFIELRSGQGQHMTFREPRATAGDSDQLGVATLVMFAATSMPLSLLAIGVFMFLPVVYSSLGEISMGEAGIVILLTRLWDFVTDPLFGWLSDRTRTRFGRRIPWMLLAWAPLSYATYKLFIPPSDAGALYLAVWSFALFTAGTALFMPYTAMGAELSTVYHQRSRVFLYRHVFAALGTLLAALLFVVTNQVSTSYFPERETLKLIAWAGITLLPIPLLFTAWKVRELPLPQGHDQRRVNWRAGLRLMIANKPYMRILGCYFANGIANTFPLTLFFFFIKQVLEQSDWAVVYLPVYFVSAIAGTPLWLFIANRYGKHIAWRMALVMAILAFSFVPFLGSGDAIPFLFVTFVAGITLGADLAMPASMLADAVDEDVLETGQRRTGIYFAVWGMAAKFAAALVVGFSLEWLNFVGFVPDMYNDAEALLVLSVMFGVCPIIFKFVALAAIWKYPLTAVRQAELRAALIARNSV